jgi:alkanesulfonate monooxygenase SsuD/methylene tetrahydromethanopterin reductase-like flavin-dependent oxidoreductase (luciferase family)
MNIAGPNEVQREAMRKIIDNWFQYHEPTPADIDKYARIREAAKALAYVISDECPISADRTVAFRKLRECVMTANASIACNS